MAAAMRRRLCGARPLSTTAGRQTRRALPVLEPAGSAVRRASKPSPVEAFHALNMGRLYSEDRYEEWLIRDTERQRQEAYPMRKKLPPLGHMGAFGSTSDDAVARIILAGTDKGRPVPRTLSEVEREAAEEAAAADAGGEGTPEELAALVAAEEAARAAKNDFFQQRAPSVPGRVVPQKLDEQGRAYGTGKRKRAIARVWVKPGTGVCYVNGLRHNEYFGRRDHREQLFEPVAVCELELQMDIWCTVKGGGHSGQAQAIRLGVARALQSFDPSLRPALKKTGLLTRDARIVEPKKSGLVKARKGPTWKRR